MKQSDHGILLNRISYSETSYILTFYTKKDGIQKFIYQGGKKKSTNVFPLNCCELTYYKRNDSELGKLTQADSNFPLLNIQTNPIKSSIAFFLVDVLKQTLQTNQAEPLLYAFLEDQILALNETEKTAHFPLHFLAKYTEHIGISPELTMNPRYFSMTEGDFHSEIRLGELSIDGELCEQLLMLFEGENPTKEYRKELLTTLLHYYKIHSPKFDVSNSLEIITALLYD